MSDWQPEQPLLVANAMATRFPRLERQSSLQDAARLLSEAAVDLLPVMDGGRLLGTVGSRDLALATCGEGRDPASTAVTEAMRPPPVQFSPDLAAGDALARMHGQGCAAALVAREDGEVAGLLSIHRLYELLHGPRDVPEAEYTKRVRGEPL